MEKVKTRNHKIVVVSIIVKDNKLLLIKRAKEPFKNSWSFIGGISVMMSHHSPDPITAAKEEVLCDLSCGFSPTFFKYYYDDSESPTIILVFYGNISGNPNINKEFISQYKWFSFVEAKKQNLSFGGNSILEDFLKFYSSLK